ncbi:MULTISPECIES: hypothetical protein [unclassified Rhizobium]|uniref:PepSY domain-containing protein n=1 Tax=unclassified Rhizobium TaxID=2613769 RepID=UPI000648F642|nr:MULTISPECIES: hypothetical protein [unclassified Rhizobium]OJY68203.1 MAG: hypothetical protein BGP09_27870 [Rhizobium sp. 60-20]RKD35807.1 putative membrane protein YkoI [Rhizobium sp. WW_1]
MRFRSLRALPRFAVVAVALHLPATVQAHEWASDFDNVRVIQIADGGDSDGSSNDGSSASESNSDSSDSDAGSDDSDGDQQSNSEAHGGNRSDDKFDGPNGALKAVQADRALPLGDIVAIARHLTDGQIIDTRLRPVKGILQYELKVLETNNEVRRYSFNARTGKLIRVR